MKTTLFIKFKFVTILTLVLFTKISSSAQITRGTFRLGPNISYSSSTEKYEVFDSEYKSQSTKFVVSASYFPIDNLEFGLGIQLLNSSSETDDDKLSSTSRALGPNLTYMVPLNKNVYLPISFGLAYNLLKIEDEFDEFTFKGWGYDFGAGLEYVVANKLGARLSMQYTFAKFREDELYLESDLSGFQIGVGVNFYFTKK